MSDESDRNQQLIKMLSAASKNLERNRRLLEAAERLAEITQLLRDLARESIDGKNVPRGEYIAFQLRLGDALDQADATLAAYQKAAKP